MAAPFRAVLALALYAWGVLVAAEEAGFRDVSGFRALNPKP